MSATKPRLSCLDARFKYRSSAHTDVAKTFERARRREQLLKRIEARRSATKNVVPIGKKAQGGT